MTTPAPGKAELDKAGWLQTEHLADDAITADKIAADAVETDQIKDDAITAAKADTFLSDEITGAGAASPTVHGLGASPSMVLAIVTEHATPSSLDMVATADATNVYVDTGTSTKYKVFAWL